MNKKTPLLEIVRKYSSEFILVSLLLIISGIYIYSHPIPNDNVAEILVPETSIFRITPAQITRGNTSKQQIIFTFDGGGGIQSIKQILEVLTKHNLKSTFFLTGEFVKNNQEIVKSIYIQGHEIFNHTYDHPHLRELPDGRIGQELEMMNNEMERTLGISTKPYFRAPYGETSDRVLDAAARAGYRSVLWTVDASDWEESKGITGKQVTDKILNNLAPGVIYLMHIGDNITGNILDDVLSKIEIQGYKIVPLTQGI